MRSRKRRSGFLLLEALIALSLLAMGLEICLETFSLVRAAMKRDERRWELAPCAEKKLLESSLGVSIPGPACPSDVAWTGVTSALPGRLEETVFRARWPEGDRTEEETFESIRTTN